MDSDSGSDTNSGSGSGCASVNILLTLPIDPSGNTDCGSVLVISGTLFATSTENCDTEHQIALRVTVDNDDVYDYGDAGFNGTLSHTHNYSFTIPITGNTTLINVFACADDINGDDCNTFSVSASLSATLTANGP